MTECLCSNKVSHMQVSVDEITKRTLVRPIIKIGRNKS